MRMKENKSDETDGFNMTPLIDVTFQLIIFFMLVADFTQTDLARVRLAWASEVIEDVNPDKIRLMINVCHEGPGSEHCDDWEYDQSGYLIRPCLNQSHWQIKIGSRSIDMQNLGHILVVEGDLNRSQPDNQKSPSNRTIMIRADAAAPYRVVQKVFEACARAVIWKVEVGAAKPALE